MAASTRLDPDHPAMLDAHQQSVIDTVRATARSAAFEAAILPRLAVTVALEPGDSTRYDLALLAPGVPVVQQLHEPSGLTESTAWLVAVGVGERGLWAAWDGGSCTPANATRKWAPGEHWTGVVVAAFLSEFSGAWAELQR